MAHGQDIRHTDTLPVDIHLLYSLNYVNKKSYSLTSLPRISSVSMVQIIPSVGMVVYNVTFVNLAHSVRKNLQQCHNELIHYFYTK